VSAIGRIACLVLPALLAFGCGGADDGGPAAVRIRGHTWRVELATHPSARRRGLSGRTELPPGTGMLFVFPDEQVLHFHMKDCHVPLDVAFISSRLTVLKIETMRLEPDPSDPKAVYRCKWPARYALEVPAGELRAGGVSAGDRVELLGAARSAAKDAR